MSRIFMINYDDWGCGYYRCQLPVNQCYGDLSKSGINLHMHKELHSDEAFYDAYIIHRIPVESSIYFLQGAQKRGQKFVLDLDDDIFNIPEWMPSEEFKNPKWSLKRAIDMADEIWTSTETLADVINKPGKTYVLPNLVDYPSFLNINHPCTDPIRILWMGSVWHDKDLEQVVRPIHRLLHEYGEKIQFLFWGCLPTTFSDFERIPGQNIAALRQKSCYGKGLLYLSGLEFRFYFDRLVKLHPYIGLAPLYDCQFNKSKSEIKHLEYTMAHAATIATNLDPYHCIENGKTGLLVEPGDEEGWYQAIKKLIEDRNLRDSLVVNAREKVFEKHSWQSQNRKDQWIQAFSRLVK